MRQRTNRSQAACANLDPEIFFPMTGGAHAARRIEKAKRICAGCVLVAACLQFAITNGESGVWGGTTEDERRLIRRRTSIMPRMRGISELSQDRAGLVDQMAWPD